MAHNNINFDDISNIIHGLSVGNVTLKSLLDEAKEKGSKILVEHYTEFIQEIKKADSAVNKIRKELALDDDPVYSERYKSNR